MTNTTVELSLETLAALKANAAAIPTEDLAKELAFAQASVPSPSASFPEAVAWCQALLSEQAKRLGLDNLTNDGDVIDLSDGRKLRLKMWADDIDPFREYETYGKVEWDHRGEGRPQGFDGNAEKLMGAWWQPPADGPKRGTEEFAKFRSLVRDLIEFGMKGVTLEVLAGEDAYHRPIVVEVASLGGIDSLENGYLAEVIRDLAEELGLV